MSAVLELWFQLRWVYSTEEVQSTHSTLMEMSSHMQREPDVEPPRAEESTTSEDLLSYMKRQQGQSQMTTNELGAYLALSSSKSSITFWHAHTDRFPMLHQLHLQHHCTVSCNNTLQLTQSLHSVQLATLSVKEEIGSLIHY